MMKHFFVISDKRLICGLTAEVIIIIIKNKVKMIIIILLVNNNIIIGKEGEHRCLDYIRSNWISLTGTA